MKTKIYLSFILIFLTLICQSQQSSWIPQNSPLADNFRSVHFIDQENGWIVSEQGNLILTKDGGNSWQTKNLTGVLESVFFSDLNHGCIVGRTTTPADSSLIYITNDGGENWTEVNHNKINRLNDIFFANNDIGWAVGSQGELNKNCCYYTSDGGNTWIYQSSALVIGAELFGVHFRDENIGQLCGTDGAFFTTNNGGTTSWAIGISMPVINLNDIYNFGLLNGCIVGDEGTILYTINNWYQFIEQTSNTTENLNGVSGDTLTNKLWVVGDNGTILYSPYYLLGWTFQNSGVTEHLNDICMLNEMEGWAVGNNGTLLHYSPYISVNEQKTPDFYIYPNPAYENLIVQNDNSASFNKIQIHRVDGNIVLKKNFSGKSQLSIDVSKYKKGLYLVTAIGNSKKSVKKILIR